MGRIPPREVLHGGDGAPPIIPGCEHIAGREKFMRKALALQEASEIAFDVTLDLEDGAPSGREAEQAELVVELLRSRPPNHPGRVGVRVHDIRHPACIADIETVVRGAGEQVGYLVLPKVRNRGDVEYFSSVLQEQAEGLARYSTWPIHILIESQRALHDVETIAAHPDVEVLDFGSMDFISDHQGAIPSSCMRSPGQFEHALLRRAKTRMVAAALLYNKVPAHNVTIDLDDPEAASADARRARTEFGFLRMWSVHPKQIEPITRAMAPTLDETEHAIRVLSAGQDADWGPVRVENELYDRASYRFEWTLLQRAHLAGQPIDPEALDRFDL